MRELSVLVLTSSFPTFAPHDATFPFIYELSKYIRYQSDFRITVLTPLRNNSLAFEQRDGLDIHRFWYGFYGLCEGAMLPKLRRYKLLWLQVPFLLFFYFLNFCMLSKKVRPDIIHAHWLVPQGFIAVLYKKFVNRKIKIICTGLGADVFSLRGQFFSWVKHFTISGIDILTVVTRDMVQEIHKSGFTKGRKIFVIPTAADDKKFSPHYFSNTIRTKHRITGAFMLFVGRLAEKKGVQYLLRIMPRVIASCPDVTLVVIGGGPLEHELKELSRILGIMNHVLFLGPVPNNELPHYFATADIFIAPSVVASDKDSEGLPVVLVEALLSKVCVVASNLRALSDIIIDGRTGIQVDVKDEDAFSRSIIALLKDKNRRQRIAEEGYRYALKYFTLQTVSQQYIQLYRAISENYGEHLERESITH